MKWGTVAFILGLIVVAFGVGGIEDSITNDELFDCLVVSVVGLLSMLLGVSYLKKESA